ncbi:MAG: NPCBM/NEW2 domain-containing protein, partial [Oscillospiraceae bacterium]|nr:NPCBM/NEW2 domain-containing protein [Oscillospiraceae bacterium]
PFSPPEPITIPEPLTTSFIETVPPYDVVASARNVSTDTPAWVKMGGIDYQNSICYLAHDTMRMFNTQVISSLHNLNGRYTLLSAEVGRIDGKSAQDTTFSFYGDDERLLKTYVIKAQDLPKQISIDVADVRQLKIKVTFSSDTNAAQGCAFVGTIE